MAKMKKLLLFILLFGCEDERIENQNNHNLFLSWVNLPRVEIEYCTFDQINRTFYERIWIRHYANYYLSATTTIILEGLDFVWEVIDQYETDPENKIYWEYGNNYGRYIYDPITITYGTELIFNLPKSFVGHLSIGGHSPPETKQDSLDRIRIHNILDFYSKDFPFEIWIKGYYLLSQSDTTNFNIVYHDKFTVNIDSTECN